MAVATGDEATTRVVLANTSTEYPTREFQTDPLNGYVDIDATQLEWSNYFKGGYKVILSWMIGVTFWCLSAAACTIRAFWRR
jgi:galactokinase